MLLSAIVKKLEFTGFTVEGFLGGSEALERLKQKDNVPDLVWLDYYLQDMTGDVFLKKMKESLGEKAWVPVMIVSNSASPQKVDESLKNGASKYFLKADHRLEDLVAVAKEMTGQEN